VQSPNFGKPEVEEAKLLAASALIVAMDRATAKVEFTK
jgi:hypothetical protein